MQLPVRAKSGELVHADGVAAVAWLKRVDLKAGIAVIPVAHLGRPVSHAQVPNAVVPRHPVDVVDGVARFLTCDPLPDDAVNLSGSAWGAPEQAGFQVPGAFHLGAQGFALWMDSTEQLARQGVVAVALPQIGSRRQWLSLKRHCYFR